MLDMYSAIIWAVSLRRQKVETLFLGRYIRRSFSVSDPREITRRIESTSFWVTTFL